MRFSLALILLASCQVLLSKSIDLLPTNVEVPSENMFRFQGYELVSLDFDALYQLWESGENTLNFSLHKADAFQHVFQLQRWDLRADNYRRTGGNADRYTRLPAAQYRGAILGEKALTSIFTLDEHYMLGNWQSEEEEYFLEPLWLFWEDAPRDVYILYTPNDLVPEIGDCAWEADELAPISPLSNASAQRNGCLNVTLAIASDSALLHTLQTELAVENFMLNVLALTQTDYDNQFGDEEFDVEIRFEVTEIFISTSIEEDPYLYESNNPFVILSNFANWNNVFNPDPGFRDADIASLWSGREFDGTTIGLAYRPGVCTDITHYNILENFSNTQAALQILWSHELGHNFNAPHDDEGSNSIMAPSYGVNTGWSVQSRDTINEYLSTISCLSSCNLAPPSASAIVPYDTVCTESQVAFYNTSLSSVDSISWYFPGGSPDSSQLAFPVIDYNLAGDYLATLTAYNAAGSNSTDIPISVGGDNDQRILYYENFEGDTINIGVENPDNNFTWNIASVDGNLGNLVAFIDNYSNNGVGEIDQLILPIIDCSEISGTSLELEYAYAIYPNAFDTFRIKVATPAGISTIFTSAEDFPTDSATTSPFVPVDGTDWCADSNQCLSLDLSAYDGMDTVLIILENENDYGNLIFIDNISVFGSCSDALPVEWLDFIAITDGNRGFLYWSVNQDDAHSGFFVERSMQAEGSNESAWESIAWIPKRTGQGNVSYEFIDEELRNGQTYFYRLRQRDIDGQENLSTIRRLSIAAIGNSIVWPNPATDQLEIQLASEVAEFQLLDALGRTLISGQISEGHTLISLQNISRGVYWLVLDQQGIRETIRVIKN